MFAWKLKTLLSCHWKQFQLLLNWRHWNYPGMRFSTSMMLIQQNTSTFHKATVLSLQTDCIKIFVHFYLHSLPINFGRQEQNAENGTTKRGSLSGRETAWQVTPTSQGRAQLPREPRHTHLQFYFFFFFVFFPLMKIKQKKPKQKSSLCSYLWHSKEINELGTGEGQHWREHPWAGCWEQAVSSSVPCKALPVTPRKTLVLFFHLYW